jgi:type IV pilus assembly protein PilW
LIDIKIKTHQYGFTLTELLVTMLVSSALILLVSNLYISIFSSQRSQYEKAAMYDNANTALAVLGRNIELAGYYPINYSIERSGNINVAGQYSDTAVSTTKLDATSSMYKFPLNGCTAQYWDGSTGICTDQPSGVDSDSIVINYFTDDPYFNVVGGLDLGIASNCARGGPNTDANIPNTKVFLISNRYSLAPTPKAYAEKASINITNLACDVNIQTGIGTTGYQALVEGIDQLRFTYLQSVGLNTQFAASTSVTDWSQVAAVKVCLVARSVLQTKSIELPYSLNNCDNKNVNYSDGISRQKFSRIFTVRNNRTNMRLSQ